MNSHESKVIRAAKAAKKRDIATAKAINKLLRKLAAQPEPYIRLAAVNGERV